MKLALFFLLIAVVKNFAQIPASLFESDQETLTIAAKNILEGHFSLIGAPTSVGGMFIAPFYNYFVAFWLWLFRGNPYIVAILGAVWLSLTVPAIYLLGKKIYSEFVGIFAAIISLLSINFVNFDQVPPLLFPLPLLIIILIYVLETRPAVKFKKSGFRRDYRPDFKSSFLRSIFNSHSVGFRDLGKLIVVGFSLTANII